MNTIPSVALRKQVSEHLDRVRLTGERIIITQRGKPAAVLVPIGDLDKLEGDVKSIESMTRNTDYERARKPLVISDTLENLSQRYANAVMSECSGNVGVARRVLLEALLKLENSEV